MLKVKNINMQITQNVKSRKKQLLIGIVIAVALILLGLCYFYIFKGTVFGQPLLPGSTQQGGINLDKPTPEQIKNSEQIKKNSINPDTGKLPVSGSDQPAEPIPQSNGKAKVEIVITASEQIQSTVQIRTLIAAVDTSGTCTLTMTKSGQTVTKTSSVQNGPTTSTCQGFNIPLDELGAGNWQTTITYESATLTGTTSKTLEVK